MEPKFVTGKPALVMGKTLVIADLHIGIEYEYYQSGIRIPSTTENMRKEIESLIKLTGAENLVILGDVKHKVPGITRQELREIPEFLRALSDMVNIEIVPGNHDSGLGEFIPDNVRLHPSRGFGTNECYFFHGHTWPSHEFLEKKYVFVGHEHPQIEFRDSLGYRYFEPVWVRAKLRREILRRKYRKIPPKLPELVILPRFNKLSGGIAMNKPVREIEREHELSHTGIGPLVRSADLKNSDIYLLDGTFMGKLKTLF